MYDVKSVFASKTIWGGIIALMASAAAIWGYAITPADQAQIVELITGIGGITPVQKLRRQLEANHAARVLRQTPSKNGGLPPGLVIGVLALGRELLMLRAIQVSKGAGLCGRVPCSGVAR